MTQRVFPSFSFTSKNTLMTHRILSQASYTFPLTKKNSAKMNSQTLNLLSKLCIRNRESCVWMCCGSKQLFCSDPDPTRGLDLDSDSDLVPDPYESRSDPRGSGTATLLHPTAHSLRLQKNHICHVSESSPHFFLTQKPWKNKQPNTQSPVKIYA